MSGCGLSADGGARSRCGRMAGSESRTSGSARPAGRDFATTLRRYSSMSQASCSQRAPSRPQQHHRGAAAGNPDASRFFAGRASGRYARHGSCDRGGSPGNVGPQRAGPDAGLPARSCRRSRSGRDHSSCRRAPERGSEHTGTAVPALPPDQLRAGMDDVRDGWNTPPACVLGTVRGTASNPDLAV